MVGTWVWAPTASSWTQDCLLDHVLLETHFLCECGHCLCCRNPDYLLVDCRRACPSTEAWGLWDMQGKEELDRLLAQKQSLLLSSPLQTGWLFQQSTWLSLCDRPDEKYEMKNMGKRLEEKIKNSPSYICYLEQAEEVTEPKSLDRQW